MLVQNELLSELKQPDSVLIHPTAVDFASSESASRFDPGYPQDVGEEPHIQEALLDYQRILELQTGRDSSNRAVHVVDNDPSELRAISAQSLQLMEHLGQVVGAQGLRPSYYGLADVNTIHEEDAGNLLMDTYNGLPMTIRTEGDLTAQAAKIAHTIRTSVENGDIEGAQIHDDTTVVREGLQGPASFLLYGYTFRRDPLVPEESIKFPKFPACEAFLAATVLEQVAMADSIVRIVPRTFKKKEYAARWILHALGAIDLPVVSVAVGDDGGINKVIQWSQAPSKTMSLVTAAIKSSQNKA